MSEAELYPGLTRDDILAAIAYSAEAARDRVIPVPAETAGSSTKISAGVALWRDKGHDIDRQKLSGDDRVFQACIAARRARLIAILGVPVVSCLNNFCR